MQIIFVITLVSFDSLTKMCETNYLDGIDGNRAYSIFKNITNYVSLFSLNSVQDQVILCQSVCEVSFMQPSNPQNRESSGY